MRPVAIIGIGHTTFGTHVDRTVVDLMGEAALLALEDAGMGPSPGSVDQLLVGSMGAGILNHQTGVASSLASTLNLVPTPAELIENGPASGASAIRLGHAMIAGGTAETVLVVGGELMKVVSGSRATDFVATLLHPEVEYQSGMTLPAFAAMFTRLYMERYGLTLRDLSRIAVRAHRNGALNPVAHVRKEVTMEAIHDGPAAAENNRTVADPLRLYDVCPVSDGAAAVLLCAADSSKLSGHGKSSHVMINGIGAATDYHAVQSRKDPLYLEAVYRSAQRAYRMAELTPDEISFGELHDAFLILELAIAEEIGLFPRGKAKDAVAAGETDIDGRIPLNPSGGLKAKGHPLGATGVSQVCELVKQLRGQAEAGRQVRDPRYGIAVNFGGFGNNVITTICSQEEI